MMRYCWAMIVLFVAALAGCRMFDEQATIQGNSPLRPAQQSPDSVAIEMMWVRFPAGDPLLNGDAWQAIDETRIDPGVRRELANNGLRVGLISGALPAAMDRAINQDQMSSGADEAEPGTAIDLVNEPKVRRRMKQLRRRERWEIQASEVYRSMPLLVNKGREPLSGKPYPDAQAMYALRVDPKPDRTVLMELTPEVHWGQPKLRFTAGDEGILRSGALREREVFDYMQVRVALAPGEMLVLMSMPDCGSRLGEYFHMVDSAEGRQQKLILLRLAQVPPSDTFAGE